jgi:hypothetical protein
VPPVQRLQRGERQARCKSCQIICYSEHLRAPQRLVLGLYAPGLRVTNPVHTGKLSHVPRVPPPTLTRPRLMARVITHAMFTSSLCYASHHHDVLHHAIMMLCIISCIYGTHAASSSSHCLTSLYFFFFFFFVIITYSLPYHDSSRRSDVTSLPLLGRGSPRISYLMGTRLSTMFPTFSQFVLAMR